MGRPDLMPSIPFQIRLMRLAIAVMTRAALFLARYMGIGTAY